MPDFVVQISSPSACERFSRIVVGRSRMQAHQAVKEAIKAKKVHPRLAAMVVGVARVAEACKLRGWV